MPSLPIFLIQLIIVLGAARCAGWLAQRLRQPRVVGEMAAGILLGPSLLGRLAPELMQSLFDGGQLGGLQALSQLGLLLFMFLVGLELQPQQLRGQGRAAVLVSLFSILVPFLLGALLASALYQQLADPRVPALHFSLFLGTALCIVAFPVLARILSERKLLATPLGALAIACAATNDLVAWCLLAGVVLLFNTAETGQSIWLMLLGTAGFGAAMLLVARPLAAWLLVGQEPRIENQELAQPRAQTVLGSWFSVLRNGAAQSGASLAHSQLAGILLALLAAAAVTDWLGIHALIGAFLAGAILPRDAALEQQLRARLEDLTVVFLLPLFFASIGLRTNIGLLEGSALWLAGGLLLAAAMLGKLGGTALAARLAGIAWREALALGALLNTRGLMELVVASIGLELGVITPTVFTILVLIALITTCLTGPLLDALRVTAAPVARDNLAMAAYPHATPHPLPPPLPGERE